MEDMRAFDARSFARSLMGLEVEERRGE
jgi:hypothetical protein